MTIEELIEELKRFHPKDRVELSIQDGEYRHEGRAWRVNKSGSNIVIEGD
jgi:hypothetical protein